MKTTLVIFGAPDPEEQLARKIAEKAGCIIATATIDDKPVHAGNAYKSDGFTGQLDCPVPHRVILFECGGKELESWVIDYFGFNESEVIRCDHHRPGDPGFDKGPDEFWDGSSLGQMCGILDLNIIKAAELIGEDWRNLWMVAAGDHCPAAAYHLDCPGIRYDDFFAMRIRQRAEFLSAKNGNASPEEYMSLLVDQTLAAEDYLRAMPRHPVLGVKVIRGEIPELREAALKSYQTYVSYIPERNRAGNLTGREKIVLGGYTTPEQVEKFLSWAKELPNRVGEPYGVPSRGYAGVVIKN